MEGDARALEGEVSRLREKLKLSGRAKRRVETELSRVDRLLRKEHTVAEGLRKALEELCLRAEQHGYWDGEGQRHPNPLDTEDARDVLASVGRSPSIADMSPVGVRHAVAANPSPAEGAASAGQPVIGNYQVGTLSQAGEGLKLSPSPVGGDVNLETMAVQEVERLKSERMDLIDRADRAQAMSADVYARNRQMHELHDLQLHGFREREAKAAAEVERLKAQRAQLRKALGDLAGCCREDDRAHCNFPPQFIVDRADATLAATAPAQEDEPK